MKTNKSTGPNSIPTHILKISNQIICKPVTYLINLSLSNVCLYVIFIVGVYKSTISNISK